MKAVAAVLEMVAEGLDVSLCYWGRSLKGFQGSLRESTSLTDFPGILEPFQPDS